ncbi:hypothetical protein FJM65_12245 [Pontibacter mangrovi]|uniref:STAS/SEC14 domain-containing protein n=1 Tax=Pontibacter mangrovi TaxID=2589816 RepID=A0A501W198_9BACT|nr:hypothetical protein FJM65_12245 [Pontibacter mangrovi]
MNGSVFSTLISHPDYIESKWNGHITAGDVITTANVYLDLMQTHKCPGKLLNDKTTVTGDWSEANDWLEFEWLPLAIQSGLQYIAHIYSSNMFSRLSARDLYLRINPRVGMQNFNNREEGLAWLLSQPMKVARSA